MQFVREGGGEASQPSCCVVIIPNQINFSTGNAGNPRQAARRGGRGRARAEGGRGKEGGRARGQGENRTDGPGTNSRRG